MTVGQTLCSSFCQYGQEYVPGVYKWVVTLTPAERSDDANFLFCLVSLALAYHARQSHIQSTPLVQGTGPAVSRGQMHLRSAKGTRHGSRVMGVPDVSVHHRVSPNLSDVDAVYVGTTSDGQAYTLIIEIHVRTHCRHIPEHSAVVRRVIECAEASHGKSHDRS